MAKSYRKAGTRLMTGVEELDKKLTMIICMQAVLL